MIALVYILDSIAKGLSLFFRIVRPIPTSSFLQLNDICNCYFCVVCILMHIAVRLACAVP